jgi:hypothetical protein
MKKGGTGGSSTQTGLIFEKKIDLASLLKNLKGYKITLEGQIFFENEFIGLLCPQNNFYKNFLKPRGINWDERISSRLLPDEALINEKTKTVYIIEKKFQKSTGSVDEKLQTCEFKKIQYNKLVKNLKYTVSLIYVLSEWFKQDRYKDSLEYILEKGCKYFFENLPIQELGLPPPSNQ